MKQQMDLSIEKIERFNLKIPRYTSYPTVPNWGTQDFNHTDYLQCLHEIAEKEEPISIYIHIPFCSRRCLFCGCNTIITSRQERSVRYLNYLKKEIDTVGNIIRHNRQVIQLHLGGGTPTHLLPQQLDDLFSYIEERFNFLPDAERSIEIHPSVTTREHLDVLANHHFNRLSIGVQDFDREVQTNLNRHQTYEETAEVINYARILDFDSINVDLIYGLPYQTMETMHDTINKIFELRPDRIALYSYAHFPQFFRHHQGIPLKMIPQGSDKLQLFLHARSRLLDHQYEQVGFDHFALPTDSLWRSYQNKTLRRNFMGYTTKAGTDLIAFGWSGISELSNCYAQHAKDMEEYEELVDQYGVATIKGYRMNEEDRIRKQLIMDILCQNEVNIEKLETQTGKSLDLLYEIADQKMPALQDAGFVKPSTTGWQLTTEGQIFARVVAASFDAFYSTDHIFSNSV